MFAALHVNGWLRKTMVEAAFVIPPYLPLPIPFTQGYLMRAKL